MVRRSGVEQAATAALLMRTENSPMGLRSSDGGIESGRNTGVRGRQGARWLPAAPVHRRALVPLERGLREGQITARGADRALRVAWTLSDLEGLPVPGEDEVGLALGFRELGFRDRGGA